MIFKSFLLILFFAFVSLPIFSEEQGNSLDIQIIHTKSKAAVTWKEILLEMDKNEILVWGEEHDDVQGHTAQIEFLKKFSDMYPAALSLEMFEKDQQLIVDEYYRGFITEKQLLASISHWKNFTTDYLPLVKSAKESYTPIVCANPPRRYVNAVSRKGMMAYSDFSDEAYKFIPAAYSLGLYQSEPYLAKLRAMFQDAHTTPSRQTFSAESMILAQYMWDHGMAEAISRENFRSGRKIFHINGRFHSDEEGGVVYRLRKIGHKVLVISVFPEGKEETQNFDKLADFVILTKRR
jgi:uncharacterized iron-regulated protein